MNSLLLNVLVVLFWTQITLSNVVGFLKLQFATSDPHTVFDSRKIELKCCYKSSSKPSFKWYHGQKQVAVDPYSLEDGFVESLFNENESDVYCSEITNSIAEKSHEGEYMCLADNGLQRKNHSVYLMIRDEPTPYKPEVKAVDRDVKVFHSENVTLSCNARYVDNKGFHIYSWYFNNDSTLQENSVSSHKYYKGKADTPDRLQMNLTIVNVTENNLGEYQCLVRTQKGLGRDTIRLSLATRPTPQYEARTDDKPKDKTATYAFALLGVFIAFVLLSVISIYERRKRKHKQTQQCNRGDFEFDLFISCSRENGEFVQDYLMPLLENSPYNLKVCYHHRDFALGQDILENMANAVYCSQKVLIVVSDNYLESEYCKYEMDAALNREINEKYPCLALIRLSNMNKKLPNKLKSKNFLDLSNDKEQKYIDKRLKSFLKDLCKEHVEQTQRDENSSFEMEGVVLT